MHAEIRTRKRLLSIDILRGLVMVIMALDHTRDFFHETAMTSDPLDLATTSVPLFFTRWITHLCAPVFVFLSGTSAYLLGQQITTQKLSVFLLKRGLWLVIAEVTIMTFALTFNPRYNMIFLQVIWAIGCSMILLGLLVRLPFKIVLFTGIIIFAGHNLLDYVALPSSGAASVLLNVFVTGGASFYPLGDSRAIAVLYKVLPWAAVMMVGYGAGYFYGLDTAPAKRKKALLAIGTLLVLIFVLLRWLNVYGDPSRWSSQKNFFFTILSFINTTKYPPSLLFACMTLGPAIILLAFLEGIPDKIGPFFITFGRVPFFYFIIHFYLIHLLCLIAFYLSGYNNSQISDPKSPFLFRPESFGYDLLTVYGIWLLVIIIMYPLCQKYGHYKLSQKHWWLSYL